MNVLVIDDLQHDRKLWEYFIKEHPQVVTVYANGPDRAEDLLREKEFDLVFTDFFMGLKNAMDVLEIVNKHCPSTPVYLVTGRIPDEKTQGRFQDVIDKGNLKSKMEEIFGER